MKYIPHCHYLMYVFLNRWSHSFNEKVSEESFNTTKESTQPSPRKKAKHDAKDERDQELEHSVPKVDSCNVTTQRPSGMTSRQMGKTGLKVKRLLDQGRVEFLRAQGLEAYQVQYCSPVLSPECYMIIAYHAPDTPLI